MLMAGRMIRATADVHTSALCAPRIRPVLRAIKFLIHMDQTHGMGGFAPTGRPAAQPWGATVFAAAIQKIIGFCLKRM